MTSHRTTELPAPRPLRVRAPTLSRAIGIAVDRGLGARTRSGMPTAEKIPDADVSLVQTPRTDLLAGVISVAIGLLAYFGLLPLGLSAEQAIAVASGLAGLAAFVRALWERRAELNRKTILAEKDAAIDAYKVTLADAQARAAADRAHLEGVMQVVRRAADPADSSALSPAALLEVLKAAAARNFGASS